MSHTKTHIARAVSVMSLLLGLLAVGETLLSTPAVAKPAKASAPAAAGCKNYKGAFVITTDNPTPEDGTTIHILGSGLPGQHLGPAVRQPQADRLGDHRQHRPLQLPVHDPGRHA